MVEASKDFYRDAFRNAPVGIAVSDSNGMVVDVNDFLLKMGPWEREDLLDKPAMFFYADGELVRDKILALAKEGNGLHNHGMRFRRRNGNVFLARMSMVPFEAYGETYRVVVVADISTPGYTEL